jgi:hypothetical protein
VLLQDSEIGVECRPQPRLLGHSFSRVLIHINTSPFFNISPVNINLYFLFQKDNTTTHPTNIEISIIVPKHTLFTFRLFRLIASVCLERGPSSSVGITTGYGLDDPGIESRWGKNFAHFQIGPGAHPAPCAMGTGSIPGEKWPGRDADHPHPPSAEVENE